MEPLPRLPRPPRHPRRPKVGATSIEPVLADTAMTTAIISQLPAGSWAPTIELKMNFIRPVTEATGRLSAIGSVIHIGGKVAVAESRILDADGVLYAHSTSTCAIKRAAPA